MRVVKYSNDCITNLPVSGGGSDIPVGALLKPGVTAGTDFGALIVSAANSTACADGLRCGRASAGATAGLLGGHAAAERLAPGIARGRITAFSSEAVCSIWDAALKIR
jgi:hypothetical protein